MKDASLNEGEVWDLVVPSWVCNSDANGTFVKAVLVPAQNLFLGSRPGFDNKTWYGFRTNFNFFFLFFV